MTPSKLLRRRQTALRGMVMVSLVAVFLMGCSISGPEKAPPFIDSGENLSTAIGKVPSWNIFAPWKITKIHFNASNEISPLCTRWWESAFPGAVKISGSNEVELSGDVPTSPKLPQYPRWLGSKDSQ